MVTPMPSPAVAEIFYPESDGQPMAETDVHRDLMIDLIAMLREYFHDDPQVYISGNLFLYYQEGNPRRVVAPDVFVVKGIPGGRRRIYKLWEEGRPPDVVFEVTSPSTRGEDLRTKHALYARLGVAEYFLFDPLDREDCGRPSRAIGCAWGSTGPCGRLPTALCGVRCWGWSCTCATSACGCSTRRVNGGCRSRRKSRRHGGQRRHEPR